MENMSLRSLLFSVLLLTSWINAEVTNGTMSEECPCEEAATSEMIMHMDSVLVNTCGGGEGGCATKADIEKATDEMMEKLCEILEIVMNISEKKQDDEQTGLEKCCDEALKEYKKCLVTAEPKIKMWVETKNKPTDPQGDWTKVPEEVRCCLAIMYCNVGSEYFNKFSKMRNAIAVGDWKEAAKELRASIWYKKVNKPLAEKLAKKLEGVQAAQPPEGGQGNGKQKEKGKKK